MRIKKYKNIIGLCAVKGCRKLMKTQVEVKGQTEHNITIINSFYVCHDCAWKICCPDLQED